MANEEESESEEAEWVRDRYAKIQAAEDRSKLVVGHWNDGARPEHANIVKSDGSPHGDLYPGPGWCARLSRSSHAEGYVSLPILLAKFEGEEWFRWQCPCCGRIIDYRPQDKVPNDLGRCCMSAMNEGKMAHENIVVRLRRK
jgi:hypothetical protein